MSMNGRKSSFLRWKQNKKDFYVKGKSVMREWNFENGINVEECDYDYGLHCFKVYNGGEYLGTVYPRNIEDMKLCIECLDNGEDPISGGWEDGMGNSCTIDGWGEFNG